jgi:ribosomal-protein-alanine N-acetyltransferase
VTKTAIVLRALDSPADLAALQPLYEHTDGPPYGFLQGLLLQDHCRAWCLLKGEQPVAAIWYQCMAERAEMIDLRVLGTERRQGYGRQLFWASLAALQGISNVDLEVRSSNAPARGLYEILGFRETGTRPGYYATAAGREDAVLMSLSLNRDGN